MIMMVLLYLDMKIIVLSSYKTCETSFNNLNRVNWQTTCPIVVLGVQSTGMVLATANYSTLV